MDAFSDITDDSQVAALLDAAYGGSVDLLDAVTGALAEGSDSDTIGALGDLFTVCVHWGGGGLTPPSI